MSLFVHAKRSLSRAHGDGVAASRLHEDARRGDWLNLTRGVGALALCSACCAAAASPAASTVGSAPAFAAALTHIRDEGGLRSALSAGASTAERGRFSARRVPLPRDGNLF